MKDVAGQIKRASEKTKERTEAALDKARTKGRKALTPDEANLVFDEIHRLERQGEREESEPLSPEEWEKIDKQVQIEIKEREAAEKRRHEEVMSMPIDERIGATLGWHVVNYFFSTIIPRDIALLPDYWKFKESQTAEIVQTAQERIRRFLEKDFRRIVSKNPITSALPKTSEVSPRDKREIAKGLEAILIEELTNAYEAIRKGIGSERDEEATKQIDGGWNLFFKVEEQIPYYLKKYVIPDFYPKEP